MSARRLRLAWITPSYQEEESDAWSPGARALAGALAEQHDLTVYALRRSGPLERFRIGGVEVRAFAAGPPAGVPLLKRIAPLARAIAALLRDGGAGRPDVVHALWATEPAVAGAVAARLAACPLIVSSMGGEPASMPAVPFGGSRSVTGRLMLAVGARAASVVTAGSRWHADLLRKRLGPSSAVVAMPFGIDLARFGGQADATPRRGPPRLLAVGSLLPVKGHRRLLEALALLRPRLPEELRGLSLRIVGAGPERARLEAAVVELGLSGIVDLAGDVLYEHMPDEYAAADMFVLSSHYESQCLALLEALACRVPVVSTPVGLAPELLADGRAGELADEPSARALASAMERLLLRRAEWTDIGRRAREIAQSLSVERTTQRWVDLYRRIAEEARSHMAVRSKLR